MGYEFIGLNEILSGDKINTGKLNSWYFYGIDNAGNEILLDSRENIESTYNNGNRFYTVSMGANDNLKFDKFKIKFTSSSRLDANDTPVWSLSEMKLYIDSNNEATIKSKFVDATTFVNSCTVGQSGESGMAAFDGDATTMLYWTASDDAYIAEFTFTTSEAIKLGGVLFINFNEGSDDGTTALGVKNTFAVYGIDAEGNEVLLKEVKNTLGSKNHGGRFFSMAVTDQAFSTFKVKLTTTSRLDSANNREWSLGEMKIYTTN